MRIITEPMLAPSKPLTEAQLATLQYPLMGSFKEDGMRILTFPSEGGLTRSFKQIPNRMLNLIFKVLIPPYLDGELLCGDMTFRDTMSCATSHEGTPCWTFRVFDCFKHPEREWHDRWKEAIDIVGNCNPKLDIQLLDHHMLYNYDDLLEFEKMAVDTHRKEGIMVRHPLAKYKCGRSTIIEQGLLKVKRFATAEAQVVGWDEMMENRNPLMRSETGKAKRSTASEGMVGTGMLGAWICQSDDYPFSFRVGGGMTDLQRRKYWENRDDYFHKTLSYKHTPHDQKDRPKSAVFRGFRDAIDL